MVFATAVRLSGKRIPTIKFRKGGPVTASAGQTVLSAGAAAPTQVTMFFLYY